MPCDYYSDAGPLWAITSYYNPNRYWRRRANFTQFRRHLTLPLLVVELDLGGQFELDASDAEILIRRQSGDVMWQKERLLNVALASLPKNCELVAWLDCDVIFPDPHWGQACRLLDEFALVQPFAEMRHLRPDANLSASDWAGETLFNKRSISSLLLDGLSPGDYYAGLMDKTIKARAPGHVWLARRELLESRGLYDTRVTGGGDSVLASAAYGCCDSTIRRQQMNARQTEHFLNWAEPFYAAVQGRVGCFDQPAYHLWHGDIEQRRYRERFADWEKFEFDPTRDIVCQPDGPWHWASDKPGLHALLREYFVSRNEDGACQLAKAA